ncbi:acyl carrier protein [Solwaraspora sp. WMMD406]|uniref:acyl carrier protein n=1 Tax=Solwaraspora sp. WMMD406 TaxID=3016095 RepID=UPI0024173BAE|nr:acyl carrier protein [Solwaraspora sp. WMMD406]MDG4764521.1 acyl carrier protein [Solwaraspora sp. WMMD406]
MTEQVTIRPATVLTEDEVRDWLVGKLAHRLSVPADRVNVDQYFDEFDLDSTEALVLSGELENWLGFELETTALWYHPTINELAGYIVEKQRDATA